MSRVLGVDLSSFALDLVALDEDTNRAEWRRVVLPPARKKSPTPAWERLLALPSLMPHHSWYEDIFLVAIEAPYGSNQGGTQASLNRTVGAVAASLPSDLRVPERCWIVRPDEWKRHCGIGAKAKPTWDDLARLTPAGTWLVQEADVASTSAFHGGTHLPEDDRWQNARDAFCLAHYARETNALAVERCQLAKPLTLL